MIEHLLILSRHGWDQAGQRGTFLRFRHAGTGEEVTIAPDEVPFWAAQLAPASAPASPDDWYAERLFVSCGQVRSRSGQRRAGITHNRRGEMLIFPAYAAAERVAVALNLRERTTLRQAKLDL